MYLNMQFAYLPCSVTVSDVTSMEYKQTISAHVYISIKTYTGAIVACKFSCFVLRILFALLGWPSR